MNRRAVFDGWWVVASVFVLLMANAGLGFYGLAVYLDAITDEQGLSTGSVSAATSLYFVVSGIVGRIIAPIIERRDIRIVVGAGALIAGGSMWLLGHVSTLWAIYPVYAVFAVGSAMSGLVPGTTLVTRWFHTKRSVAISVSSTGLSVGGLTLTLLASQLIDRREMAGAMPWLALAYVVVVGISLIRMWPDPELRGARPDGEPITESAASTPLMGVDYDLAVRSRFFRFVAFGFVFAMGSQVGGIAQLAKLGTERIDRPTGALAVSAVALASVVARLIGGVVASRVSLVPMTAVLAAVQSFALVLLAESTSKGALLLSALLFGCTIGNLLMLQPLVIADRFGVRNYPRIFALEQLIVTVGIAGGPFLLGALHDAVSYRLSYWVAAAMSLVGAVSVGLAHSPAEQPGVIGVGGPSAAMKGT